MTWISDDYSRKMVARFSHLIPKDFDPILYMSLHPDLPYNGVNDEHKAKEHYLLHGMRERRIYKKPTICIQNQPATLSQKPEFWNNGKNLLYFSPMAPDFDASSGGNRLLELLKILKKDLDYNIWFLCNGTSKPKYLSAVRDLGIKTLLPDLARYIYLDVYLKEAISNNIIFNNAIFSWYDIGHQYIDIVKSFYPNIKILVDTVDIHWAREQRGKDRGDLTITQNALDVRKAVEVEVYKKADVIFTVTEKDKKFVQQELGYGNNIKVLSNIHDTKNIELGNNIFFIGNYQHGPNIDAVKRCIEIYQLFQKTKTFKELNTKPQLYIAGPHLSSDLIEMLSKTPHTKYLGQIDSVTELYEDSCILLSPLNWGAGIKGKICDAGMAGMPILTSDIGNEGIDFTHEANALLANTTTDFVKELTNFFSLPHTAKRQIGLAGQKHLMGIVSKSAATNILKHSLQDTHIILSIVTYNQYKQLQICLNSILNLTKYSNYTIYISDNSSDLKTQKMLRQMYALQLKNKKIIYHKNRNNDYFIKPNNELFQKTQYANSDFVLINDDIEIIDGYWLNYLYSSAYSADYIAAAGGKTIYPNGSLAEAGAELYNDGGGRNIGRHDDPQKPIYNIQKYVGYCSGCLLYMRHDAIDKIGVFSKNLEKLYYEDSDWQYRAHAYGLKTIYDYRCEAIHNEGSTSGTDLESGAKKYQKINQKIFLSNMRELNACDIEIFNQ